MGDEATLSAGSNVASHMIFLNSAAQNGNSARIDHVGVEWTFTGNIIGVMGNRNGSMEVNSTPDLGLAGVTYRTTNLDARGLEGINDGGGNDDGFSFTGNVLTLTMRVTEPGDWIRVITEVNPVPVPAGLPLVLTALGAFGFMRSRKRKAA